MDKHDQACLKLGREVVRMINDLRKRVPAGDVGYGRRHIFFPGGDVYLIVASSGELAAAMEAGAAKDFAVMTPQRRAGRKAE